jgi:hypothetical protein
MGCLVIRVHPTGFHVSCVEAETRADYRFLTLLQDLLWRDIDALAEKAGRVAASLPAGKADQG